MKTHSIVTISMVLHGGLIYAVQGILDDHEYVLYPSIHIYVSYLGVYVLIS